MPATRAAPLSGRDSVVRIRTVVDLPAPLGPSSPKMVPACTDRLRPSSAVDVGRVGLSQILRLDRMIFTVI